MPDIEMPDGTIVNFPDDMPREQIKGMIASKFPDVVSKLTPIPQPTAMDRIGNIWEGIKSGSTFGGSDELQAGVAAGSIGIQNLLGMNTGGLTASDAYTQALDSLRQEQNLAKQQTPYSYGAGEIGGALVTGGAAAKAAPSIAGGLSDFASKGTLQALTTASGVGGVSGGLYGFGTGEGDFKQRIQSAERGGVYGGLGGVAGVGAAKALGPLASRAMSLVSKKSQVKIPTETPLPSASTLSIEDKIAASPSVMPITQNETNALSKMSRTQGDIFTKTKGQKTQLPEAQRLESEALAGQYGADTERLIRRALIQQSRERSAFIKQLGDFENTGDSGDILDGVFETIKSQSKRLKGEVNNAYDLAREGGGVKISVEDIRDGLFNSIIKVKRDGQFDISQMSFAKKPLKDLTRLVRTSQGGRFTSAKLSALEDLRTALTNGAASTKNPKEAEMLKRMRESYDDFMYKTANEAVDQGDSDAILAFRDAVQKRAEYGRLYESDKFVNDVVKGKVSADDAVKDLIGTGQLVGKKRMEGKLDAIVKAAKEDGDKVKYDLQTAFAKKLFQQSIEGVEAGNPEAAFISAAKMQTALKGLFIDNRKFAERLYGKDVLFNMQKAIKELEVIKTTQPATKNPSGSAESMIRFLNKSSMSKLPFIDVILQNISSKPRQIEKSLSDVIGEIPVYPQSKLFGAIAGGEQGAAAFQEPEVTIRAKDYQEMPQ